MYKTQLWHIYVKGKINGINSETFNELVSDYKNQLSIDNKVRIHNKKAVDAYYTRLYKSNLAFRLFKTQNLDTLTENERGILTIAYNTEIESINNLKNNNCPHIKLMQNVLKSLSTNRAVNMKVWDELNKMVPNGDGILQCQLCKTSVM